MVRKPLISILFLAAAVFSANSVVYKGITYGPEYFFAIQGEVSGQAAPGVQSVHINGKRVPIGKNLTFKAKVKLKKGQKYLSIVTRYKGLRFTKKYLVIRHPKAPKTFKIHVPQREFKKIVTRKKTVFKKRVEKKKIVKKPKPKASFGFKSPEFKDRYTIKPLAQAIDADNYGIALSSPKGGLKRINELLRKPDFYNAWRKRNKDVYINPDIQRLAKETSKYRHKPFNQLSKQQQQKIIRLNRLILEATYPLLAPKSLAEGIKKTEDENWLGFEYVAELVPGKLMIVRKVNGKYFASIYSTEDNVWIPLHEMNHQELKDLLEKGTVPFFIRPEK